MASQIICDICNKTIEGIDCCHKNKRGLVMELNQKHCLIFAAKNVWQNMLVGLMFRGGYNVQRIRIIVRPRAKSYSERDADIF